MADIPALNPISPYFPGGIGNILLTAVGAFAHAIKALVANSWAELMDGTPSKPNENDAPDRPENSLRDETHPGGRISGQRVTTQSPQGGVPPPPPPPPPRQPRRAAGGPRFRRSAGSSRFC